MSEFCVTIPVRWGDVDSFGHVSNVVYLRYLEECRGQWMESVPSRWQEGDTGPVVANININFRQPLYWPATVSVTLTPQSPGRSSVKLDHRIVTADESGDGEEVLYADASTTLVWIDKQSGEPVPLPAVVRELAGGADDSGQAGG